MPRTTDCSDVIATMTVACRRWPHQDASNTSFVCARALLAKTRTSTSCFASLSTELDRFSDVGLEADEHTHVAELIGTARIVADDEAGRSKRKADAARCQ